MLQQKVSLPSLLFECCCFDLGCHLCPFPFSSRCICFGEFFIAYSMVKVLFSSKISEDSCIAIHGNYPLIFHKKKMIYPKSPGQVTQNDIIHILRVRNFFEYPNLQPFVKIAHEIRKSKYFSNIQIES